MRWPVACIAAVLVLLGLGLCGASSAAGGRSTGDTVTPAAGSDAALAARIEAGRRIYRTGIGASGKPVLAQGAVQTWLGANAVACIGCHRASGYGMSEGSFAIRPITAPALFDQQTIPVRSPSPRVKALLGTRSRPAYTEATLARAIRTGIDSSGTPLASLMPRYSLSDEDVAALAAYLRTLSSAPSPGVDAQEIHFATVIQPDVSRRQRQLMLDVMHAFVKDKVANTRSEEHRKDAGTMRMYRAYRKWVLHVWDLSGPPQGWKAQLEDFYAAQPVFALVGGLGPSSWQPIHDFAEDHQLPSVFALTAFPGSGRMDYNLYLSRGVPLEADVLGAYVAREPRPERLLQVFREDDNGRAAAAAFRKALPPAVTLVDVPIAQDKPADAQFWRRVADIGAAAVLWLGPADLEQAGALLANTSQPVYLSHQLAGSDPLAWRSGSPAADVRLVYPSDLPPRHESRLLRATVWLNSKGIRVVDEALQVNTQFTMAMVSDAVGHLADDFSSEYFLERIEHAVSQTPMPSMFQSVSLGPGQRFAAKGSSIVQVTGDRPAQLKPLSAWLVP